MNKINTFLVLVIGAILGVAGFIYAIHGFNNMHITAVFDDLEPFKNHINVYYKGFKLGRVVRVSPSKDFTQTQVEILLNAKNLTLPSNVTAKIKRKEKKDYIEIDYPHRPSISYLKNHSVIQGKKAMNLTDYIDSQADDGGLDEIKGNLNETVAYAGETFKALTDLFHTANYILTDLRPALKVSGDNLAIASKNLALVAQELYYSTSENRLRKSFSNIEQATKNFELTTLNLANASKRADTQTIALTNCALENLNVVIRNINKVVININDIVKGFKVTLSKKFAGMRMVFGTPLSE